MADIEAELQALRGQIARMKSDLEGLAEAESVLSEKLRALGLDDSVTTVDLPTVAGLPSRRKKRTSSAPPPARGPAWVPAAVGAGLLLGVAIVVLLAMNLQQAKHASTTTPLVEAAPVVPIATSAALVAAPVPSASVTLAVSSSSEPSKPEMGALSIVCTPRCDSITDNGTPLTPGNVLSLPVPAGSHKIVVSAGASKRTHVVTVPPNQTKELCIDLEKPAAPLDRGF